MAVSLWLVFVLAAAISHCGVSGSRYPDTPPRYSNNNPIVRTTHGYVQGKTEIVQDKFGHFVEVDEFWGIPYAEKPVGDLRFRPPVPIYPWDGVYQARTPPNSCMQVLDTNPALLSNPQTPLSEDCLYLNIWRPRAKKHNAARQYREDTGYSTNQTTTQKTGLATMAWINSEFLTTGSSTIDTFNGAKLAASENVLVVTMNYRLGALGFLYSGDWEAPGNVGLLDVMQAMQWTKDNTENFGGDQDRITLCGHSVGGSLVSLLMVSPLADNLFNNVILQSANPTIRWAHQSKEWALTSASELSKQLNCHSTNNTAVVECLKQVEANVLIQEYKNLTKDYFFWMASVVDGHVLTQDPFITLQSGAFKARRVLAGCTQDDGTFEVNAVSPQQFSYREEAPLLSAEGILEQLKVYLRLVIKPEHLSQVLEDVKAVYEFDKYGDGITNVSLELLNIVLGDFKFRCPIRLLATAYAKTNQNVYLYLFDHRPDITNLASWTGAFHSSELPFVLGTKTLAIPALSPREVNLRQKMMTYWGNFAKSGNPNTDHSDGPTWPTYNPPDPGNILLVTNSADVQVGQTEARRCDYWNSLPRSVLLI